MFSYLKYGVALILAFVGVKMLILHWIHISTTLSLGVVVGVLAVSIGLSVARAPRNNRTPAVDGRN
jgi:tellurite resistance protein TerC